MLVLLEYLSEIRALWHTLSLGHGGCYRFSHMCLCVIGVKYRHTENKSIHRNSFSSSPPPAAWTFPHPGYP